MSAVIFSLYNNILRPSKLVVGADLDCFKKNIEIKWQDLIICANGVNGPLAVAEEIPTYCGCTR
jgi:hypothetical protein